MACDLCGKKGVQLIALRDMYKTNDVSDICSSCEAVVNKQLRKIQGFASLLIPKLMKQYFEVFSPKAVTGLESQ